MTHNKTDAGNGDDWGKLLADAQRGDQEAFSRFVQAAERPLIRYLFRLTGNWDLAEDVFQDTMLAVWKTLHTFDSERDGKVWVFAIARNGLITIQRKPWARTPHESLDGYDDSDPDQRVPAVLVEKMDEAAQVRARLLRLTNEQREVILLIHFEGFSKREIAEMLDAPEGTIAARYHRGITRLRKMYEEEK